MNETQENTRQENTCERKITEENENYEWEPEKIKEVKIFWRVNGKNKVRKISNRQKKCAKK